MGTSREGTITGVLIDGMIPTIDTSQKGNWASQLFTIQTSMPSLYPRVQVPELCCTSRGGDVCTTTINVYDFASYPSFTRAAPSVWKYETNQ